MLNSVDAILNSITRTALAVAAQPDGALPWLQTLTFSLIMPISLFLLVAAILLWFLPRAGVPLAIILTPLLLWAANFLVTPGDRLIPPTPGNLRIASFNMLVVGTHEADKLAFINSSGADVMSLIEVNPSMAEKVAALTETYPYQAPGDPVPNHMYGDEQRVVLLSRYPLKKLKDWGPEVIAYQVAAPTPFTLIQVHPSAPSAPPRLQGRNELLAALTRSQEITQPIVIIGDFNTTPWDSTLKPLLQSHHLKVAGSWLPTFPSLMPMTPIDLLLTPRTAKTHLWRVKVPGSDHLAIVADLTF